MASFDYPQDWLSPAERSTIQVQARLAARAFWAYRASRPADIEDWCVKRSLAIDREDVTPGDVHSWIDKKGVWSGTRRRCAITVALQPDGSAKWTLEVRRGEVTEGTSCDVFNAVMDMGVELNDHRRARRRMAA